MLRLPVADILNLMSAKMVSTKLFGMAYISSSSALAGLVFWAAW